jgi:hypothetical protein
VVGKVLGVSRSASTTFNVTSVARPEIALSKTSGKYNGVVGVVGSTFTPNSQVTLLWDGDAVGEGTTDASGAASLAFNVPLAVFGEHTVTLRDAEGRADSATYRVIPRILLNETSGSTDARLRVYFYGFAAGERVEVRWHETDSTGSDYEVLTVITVASNGRASSLIDIPADTDAGAHRVVGKVLGVSRSASTTFVVTEVEPAEAPEEGTTTATPAASPTVEVTPTATPEVTETVVPTETSVPEETLSPTVTPTETAMPEATPSATEESGHHGG